MQLVWVMMLTSEIPGHLPLVVLGLGTGSGVWDVCS